MATKPASIVLELQRDGLDSSVKVSDLLRKALVVARKLKAAPFQEWISGELNGYPPGRAIPEYRLVHGAVKAQNPVRGWIPVEFADRETAQLVSERRNSSTVAELEALLERSTPTSVIQHGNAAWLSIQRRYAYDADNLGIVPRRHTRHCPDNRPQLGAQT